MGITDYTSRLAADVLKSTYLRIRAMTESRLYFWLVWGLVAIGCGILLLGIDQPLALLVISACVGGTMMFLYSLLLILLNRRELPAAIRIRFVRAGVLVWSTLFLRRARRVDDLAADRADCCGDAAGCETPVHDVNVPNERRIGGAGGFDAEFPERTAVSR